MRALSLRPLAVFCAFATLAAGALAKSNPADFPLRVHVYGASGTSFYQNRMLDQVQGEGRANLFENSQPQAFDFSYQCSMRPLASAGMETYMARWKKPGREMQILLPIMGGKPGDKATCELKVILKPDSAYVRHNGLLAEEPASVFKKWMDEHQYDPEHGKDEPVNLQRPASPPAQPQKSAQ